MIFFVNTRENQNLIALVIIHFTTCHGGKDILRKKHGKIDGGLIIVNTVEGVLEACSQRYARSAGKQKIIDRGEYTWKNRCLDAIFAAENWRCRAAVRRSALRVE